MRRTFALLLLICVVSMWPSESNIVAVSGESTVREDLKELAKEQKQIEELMKTVHQMLEEKNLGNISMSYDDSKRIVYLQYKNSEAKKEYGDELEKTIIQNAEKIGLQDVAVKWEKVKYEFSPEEVKKQKEIREIMDQVHQSLKDKGFEVDSLSLNSDQQITVQVIETEENFLNVKGEIRDIAKDSIAAVSDERFDINVTRETRKTEQEILESQWSPILITVSQLAERKFEGYRGFAHSFHPEPLQIIIKTEIEKPFWAWRWLSDYDAKVEEIVRYVDEVIKVKREELRVKEIPYEIIVRSKDNERLN